MESPEGLCPLINLLHSSSSDAAPPLVSASIAQPHFLRRAEGRGVRRENGPRQSDLRAVHPLLSGLRVRLHRRGAALGELGGLRGEMSAVHPWNVAKRKHHRVEAAFHRGGVGTRVLLQLHHFYRDCIPHPIRSAGMEAAVLFVQRTRRVSGSSHVPLEQLRRKHDAKLNGSITYMFNNLLKRLHPTPMMLCHNFKMFSASIKARSHLTLQLENYAVPLQNMKNPP